MNYREVVTSILTGKLHPNFYNAITDAWKASPAEARLLLSEALQHGPHALTSIRSRIKVFTP